MLPVRRSPDEEPNNAFIKDKVVPRQTNGAWIDQRRKSDPTFCTTNDVVLLGGSSIADFRVRLAQSHARHDLTPSYWSMVGVVYQDRMLTAPLWPQTSPERVPIMNGIRSIPLSSFNNPTLWPNIAVIRFPNTQQVPIECVARLTKQRSIVDLPTLVLQWLGFVWGAGAEGNPLLKGFGLPGAVLIETAFGMAEVELTPGLATASSCPEAIYQAARWWRDYYEKAAGTRRRTKTVDHPVGSYVLRQPEASYVEPKPEDWVGGILVSDRS
jgi:hypothetical protein